jgi:hypothetical protein
MRYLFLALALLSPSLARAECLEIRDFIKQETTGEDKYVDTFAFRRDHRADSVLMLVKHTVEKGHLPTRWLFLHKDDPKAKQYCVVSRGVAFGQHQDMAENGSGNAFGPAGSGYPRCATDNKDFTAEEQLRYWANRELGTSSILYASTPDGPSYQFLFTNDQDWIIIEDTKGQSCFYDRGTDLMLRFNQTTIRF